MVQIKRLKSEVGGTAQEDKPFDKDSFRVACLKDVEMSEERKLHPINFDGIIGHEDLKEEILISVLGVLNADDESKAYLKSIDHHATSGILLYGLPGTGKSSILRAIETSLKNHPDIDCKRMDCSDFQGNVGTNARIINEIFDEARNTPKMMCIMLIDEIDSVMMKKKGHLNVAERTNAMQSNMDGMMDSSKILVIGSTNTLDGMENASLSRFTIINIGLPSIEERKIFISKYIMPIPFESPFNIDVVARYTEGFTGRNFRDIGMKLNKLRAANKKPIDIMTLNKEICKYNAWAGKNMKAENEDENGNIVKCIDASINVDVRNKRPLYTLESDTFSIRNTNPSNNASQIKHEQERII